VSYEDGWAHGMWFLGNSWAVKSGYYGGYPQGYLKRLRALFPDKRRVLHLFSGRVNTAEFPGDTCDVNASLEPTFIADAHDLTGVPIGDYGLIAIGTRWSRCSRTGCSLARTSRGSIRRSRCTPRHG
jgi:hypothetical protein